MAEIINPAMLTLARESRGWQQTDMAERLGMSVSNISRMESDSIAISKRTVEKVAELTKYPISFFYQQGDIIPDNLSYRKRQTVAARVITPIAAEINIMRQHVQLLKAEVGDIEPAIPAIEVTESRQPPQVADELRKRWKIEAPVIDNMATLLEAHGIIIASFYFNTARVDSRSILTDDKQPIVFYNGSLLGDRQRFSLAHELGHLVMHTFTTASGTDSDITHEANLFAAAFLMPEETIRPDFEGGVTVAKLSDLKRKWKVSMISLLYRADDLGYLTENQKKYLLKQFNGLQIRKREPVELDVPIEQPTIIKRWLEAYQQKNKYTIEQTAQALSLHPDEFMKLYDVKESINH